MTRCTGSSTARPRCATGGIGRPAMEVVVGGVMMMAETAAATRTGAERKIAAGAETTVLPPGAVAGCG